MFVVAVHTWHHSYSGSGYDQLHPAVRASFTTFAAATPVQHLIIATAHPNLASRATSIEAALLTN
jgi:hypothetical protein